MSRAEYMKEYNEKVAKKRALLERLRRRAKKEGRGFRLKLEHITEDTVDIVLEQGATYTVSQYCIRIKADGSREPLVPNPTLKQLFYG